MKITDRRSCKITLNQIEKGQLFELYSYYYLCFFNTKKEKNEHLALSSLSSSQINSTKFVLPLSFILKIKPKESVRNISQKHLNLQIVENKKTKISNLKKGEVFEYDNNFYLKIIDSHSNPVFICLQNYETKPFEDNKTVVIYDSELVISDAIQEK